jgi:hypothetical protein
VFLTRFAVDRKVMTKGRFSKRSAAHIDRLIQFWFKFGNKFYFEQTIDRGFEVRLIYSECYKDLVFSYDYPKFVKFYEYTPICNLKPWRFLDDVPRPCLVHKIDSDDQYSYDFFDYVEKAVNGRYRDRHHAMLHKRFIQFDTRTRKTSPTIVMSAPHFISIRVLKGQSLPEHGVDPIHCKQHCVPKQFRTAHSGDITLSLEAVHGRNWVNRWFGSKNGVLTPHKRFVYYGGRVTNPTAIGGERVTSSNK